jgi:hypothetical protein
MKTKKILFGGIAGGVIFFLLGWLIYGVLLMDFMTANSNQGLSKPMEEMIFWAIILSNLASGFVLSFVINWSNITAVMSGVRIGGVIGFLFASAIDFSFYSMTTMYPDLTPIFVDIIAYTAMTAITGGIVAWVMDLVKK